MPKPESRHRRNRIAVCARVKMKLTRNWSEKLQNWLPNPEFGEAEQQVADFRVNSRSTKLLKCQKVGISLSRLNHSAFQPVCWSVTRFGFSMRFALNQRNTKKTWSARPKTTPLPERRRRKPLSLVSRPSSFGVESEWTKHRASRIPQSQYKYLFYELLI